MNLKCTAYKSLFWFKQTRLAGWLFFDTRQPFQVLEHDVTITGKVTNITWQETDGDRTFDVQVDPPARWSDSVHCEITPCTAPDLTAFMMALKIGVRVSVTGDHCFDPPHFGNGGGGHEIHPVRMATVLA